MGTNSPFNQPAKYALDSSGNVTGLVDPMTGGTIYAKRRLLVKLLSPALTPVTFAPGSSTYLSWTSAVSGEDPTGIWSISDPTKLYVPSGYTRARIQFNMEIAPTASTAGPDTYALVVTHKGLGSIYDGYAWDTSVLNTTFTTRQGAISAPIVVTAGQYFRTQVQIQSDVTEKLYDDNYAHWMSIELWSE